MSVRAYSDNARMTVPRVAAVVGLAILTACTSPVAPTPTSAAATPSPSFQGIRVVDERLMPVMAEIAQHPEWAPGPNLELNAHRAVPSVDELCVEVLRGAATPLHVTVDVDRIPWIVDGIVLFDPAVDTVPRVTYQRDPVEGDPDLCRHVVGIPSAPFQANAEGVTVQGPIPNPIHAQLIREAMISMPEHFGVDRSAAVSINLLDRAERDLVTCYQGVVYQGGPRSRVAIGVTREDGEWRFLNARIVAQALHQTASAGEGEC